MRIEIFEPNDEKVFLFSRLFYIPSIREGLSDHAKDVFFIHKMLEEIYYRDRIVIGVFDDEDNLAGCVHGEICDGVFTAHLMFKRKVNIPLALSMAEDELKKYCQKCGITLNAIDGFPPEHLRASKIMSLRFGCKDLGTVNDKIFWRNGKKIPCRHMRKEIN